MINILFSANLAYIIHIANLTSVLKADTNKSRKSYFTTRPKYIKPYGIQLRLCKTKQLKTV